MTFHRSFLWKCPNKSQWGSLLSLSYLMFIAIWLLINSSLTRILYQYFECLYGVEFVIEQLDFHSFSPKLWKSLWLEIILTLINPYNLTYAAYLIFISYFWMALFYLCHILWIFFSIAKLGLHQNLEMCISVSSSHNKVWNKNVIYQIIRTIST